MEGNLLQLLKLRTDVFPGLNSWITERKYFSPAILNEQIALMGLSLLKKLLIVTSKVQNFFSIIAEEATDISNKEQMMVCIGWADEDFSVHENLVELIHVPKTDSNMLTYALKNSLIRICLPISQCHGQAYDKAST